MSLIRQVGNSILVNYPLEKTYRKRSAKWIDLNDVYVEWVRGFTDLTEQSPFFFGCIPPM